MPSKKKAKANGETKYQRPFTGGSFVVQSDGSLEQQEGTKGKALSKNEPQSSSDKKGDKESFMNFKQKILTGIMEATYGAGMLAAAATAANAIPMSNVSVKPLEGELKGRDLVSHDLGNDIQYLTGKHVMIEGETPLYASGTLGVAPKNNIFLRTGGMSEVITANTKVDYQFVNENFESAAFWYYQNNVAHKLTGARCNVTCTLKAGEFPMLKVTITGLYGGIATESVPTNVDWTAITDPIEVSKANTTQCQLHGHDIVMDGLEFDFGNAVSYRNKVNHESILLSDRSLSGKLTGDAPELATKNYFDTVISSTVGPLSIIHGTEAGKIIEVTHDKVQLVGIEYTELEGHTGFTKQLRFLKNGNFKISFR